VARTSGKRLSPESVPETLICADNEQDLGRLKDHQIDGSDAAGSVPLCAQIDGHRAPAWVVGARVEGYLIASLARYVRGSYSPDG
jgi:hypothetical protein